jgi:ADP-ribosyl-[dinitrogen reductase] hydrolase
MMTEWRFDSLSLPGCGARIGLCPCPGRAGTLADDLERLHGWGAAGLVTLVEDHELAALGVTSMRAEVEALAMRWWHLPIRDMDVPGESFEARWRTTGPELHALFRDGLSVALHCHGGLGRTGTIAARLLVEMGEAPESAIARVRKLRPGSIETPAHEAYVRKIRS